MAININVGMLGTAEAKTMRALWNLTQKVVISKTTTLPGSPTDGDVYIVPSGGDANKIAFRSEGAWLYLVPEEGWLVYVVDANLLALYDGAAWVEFTGGGTDETMELSLFAGGTLAASELLFRYEFTRTVGVPGSLVDSQGSSGVAATASAVLSLKKNGTEFATATWAAAGTEPTFAGSSETFDAGDVLSITAPASADATLADISLSIVAILP